MTKIFPLITATLIASAVLVAQQPGGRAVSLTLHEGTSMAAALSPDGRTIAIDLLGSLWTVSAKGGTATRITDEAMDARMPAWSPDGMRVAFQAYRSSTWQIWTVNRDGSDLKAVTGGPFDDREPHWSPDGTRIAFSSDRSGNYDVWSLTLASGDLQRMTTNAANDFMPAWSPDGKEIAFVSDRRDKPGVYAVDTAATERLMTAVSGAVAAPSWSPDGTGIAFNVIDEGQSRLVISDRAASRNIADPNEDVFPFRPQWVSSTELLYTADGKVKARSVTGGAARLIEFSAAVSFVRPAFTPKRRNLSPSGPQIARGVAHPAVAPDGRRIAFEAVGDLWLLTPGGTPVQLTHDAFLDTDPAWSPDGNTLAFSSDRDGALRIWLRDMRSGSERRLTTRRDAVELDAAWSPDGSRIALLDGDGVIFVATVATGEVRQVHDALFDPGRPTWSPDGSALVVSALKTYSTRFREGTNQPLRISLDGRPDRWLDPEPHKSIGVRQDYGPVWSPDGLQMAAVVGGHLATWPVARDGTPVGPPRELSVGLANSPTWAADSQHILYQTDTGFSLVDVIDGRVQAIAPKVSWTPRTIPSAQTTRATTFTIHAGRLWNGRDDQIQNNVDIVVEGARIRQISPHRADLHNGTLIDASNQTVIPGLIELHSHLRRAYGEVLGRIWLAWGITTIRIPATNPFEGQEMREAIEAGVRVGPRVFTTGDTIDGTRVYYGFGGGAAQDGGPQLELQVQRAKNLGFDLVKTYVRLPDLLQKRVIEEAHRIGLPVTSHELYPAVAFGSDGVEHIRGTSRRGYSPKVTALNRTYRDVVDLLTASKMTITPTINIQGGLQLLTLRDPSWLNDPRLRLYPASAIQPLKTLVQQPHDAADLDARTKLIAPLEKFVFQVVRGGGRVVAGTDAPINPYAIGLLLELEHYVNGGLTPAEALRTATSVSADALGVGADLGSVAPGKLADLVILDGNPLANIKDLRRVNRVVKDGQIFEMERLLQGPRRATVSSSR